MNRQPPANDAVEAARLLCETALREHRPTSLVVGPDWENLHRSLAYRLARLLGDGSQLVAGAPADVMSQLLNMRAKERHDVQLLVLPYVLHDFAHEGLPMERTIDDIAGAFPQANFLLADYALDRDKSDEEVLAALTAQIERQRIEELGRERFLQEHRAFTSVRLYELFLPHGHVHAAQFGMRTVLQASRLRTADEPFVVIELARPQSRTTETTSIA
ncbi:MAG: hypothetical protein KBC95_02190 [Candidatus Peribacteraceae bacterium]|nr:hypothetical protein [Candidatus Peribacteraceae bacterium]